MKCMYFLKYLCVRDMNRAQCVVQSAVTRRAFSAPLLGELAVVRPPEGSPVSDYCH